MPHQLVSMRNELMCSVISPMDRRSAAPSRARQTRPGTSPRLRLPNLLNGRGGATTTPIWASPRADEDYHRPSTGSGPSTLSPILKSAQRGNGHVDEGDHSSEDVPLLARGGTVLPTSSAVQRRSVGATTAQTDPPVFGAVGHGRFLETVLPSTGSAAVPGVRSSVAFDGGSAAPPLLPASVFLPLSSGASQTTVVVPQPPPLPSDGMEPIVPRKKFGRKVSIGGAPAETIIPGASSSGTTSATSTVVGHGSSTNQESPLRRRSTLEDELKKTQPSLLGTAGVSQGERRRNWRAFGRVVVG